MPLEIRPVEEADIPDVARIQMAAFGRGPGITTLLTPNPPPEGAFEKTVAKHMKAFRDEPDVHYVKVVDTDLDGKMIACAKWRINEKERTKEQLESMLPVPGPDEEGNPGLQDFMRFLHKVRLEFMGTKPFYCMFIKIIFFATNLIFHSPAHGRHRSRSPPKRRWGNASHMGNKPG
jgi:hypothetical protein